MPTLACLPLPRGPLQDAPTTIGGWRVSSWFGGRPDPITGVPSWHGGMDLVCPTGTPTHMPVTGALIRGWDWSGGGNWASILGDDGYTYGLGHHQAWNQGIADGRHPAGTLIGWANSTGKSTGSHLHFAVRRTGSGGNLDPYDALRAAAAAGLYPGAPTWTPPAPDDPVLTPDGPLVPVPTPVEALVDLRYWKIKGDDAFYAVWLEASLPFAKHDGEANDADTLVGGAVCYRFPDPATFALIAGPGTQPVILDPADPGHAGMIDALRGLPLVYQANG